MNDDRHEPAFPNEGQGEWADPEKMTHWQDYTGLTRVEHAALMTGQPCSGTPWLDEMLAKARRERLAGQIAAGAKYVTFTDDIIAERSVKLANAIIAALEGGAK